MVPDLNILVNGRVNQLEGDIPFSSTNRGLDMSFVHNDFTESNCIVDNDAVWGLVWGLVDWEMAGILDRKTAGEAHRLIRNLAERAFREFQAK